MVQGVLVGIGFAIASLPSPLVFGVLAALLSMLPVGGAAIVWVPGDRLAALSGPLGICHLHAALGAHAHRRRERPAAASSFPAGREFPRSPSSSACSGGIPAFGAIGIVVGPVVLSLVMALIEFAEETRRCRSTAPPL